MRDDIKQTKQKSVTEARPREEYKSPALKEFGSVGALTQAGTGTMGEQGGGMMA
jgi:hypothetical protein